MPWAAGAQSIPWVPEIVRRARHEAGAGWVSSRGKCRTVGRRLPEQFVAKGTPLDALGRPGTDIRSSLVLIHIP